MTEKEIHIEQLMMERLTGVIGEEDDRYLEDLLRNDTEAREQWQKIQATFEKGGAYNYLQSLEPEAAWRQVTEGIARKKHYRIVKRRRIMLAASLLLPLLVAGLFFYYSRVSERMATVRQPDNSVKLFINGAQAVNLSQYNLSSGKLPLLHNVSLKVGKGSLSYAPLNDQVSHALNTLVIPATAIYMITLSDGTEVSLNSMSELKFAFAFSGDQREVWLRGEAYFKVAKDARHPFIVHTPLTDIQVLGTEFNVNTYDSLKVMTALVEGAVSTREAGGKSVLLKPGYEAVFSKGYGFNIKTFDSNDILSWMQGIYYFRNASLENIAAVIHRWYGDTLIFDNPGASSGRFTGAMLKDKPLKEFLDNLELTSNVRYYTKNGEIHVGTR
jgi:ferric-dicitrate binding protein FerR (iron transport regulator)